MALNIEAGKTDVLVLDSDAMACSPELAIACSPPYPNALIVAPSDLARRAVATLFPRVRLPIMQWRAGADLHAFQPERGTFVLWGVDTLTPAEQRWLLVMCRRPELQIIAVAAADLFERVQRGDLLDTLYYRLNVVVVGPLPEPVRATPGTCHALGA